MRTVAECIAEIGKSGSTIFSTMDLSSGYHQMLLDKNSRAATAFTVPGKGQFEWLTTSMGLQFSKDDRANNEKYNQPHCVY